MNNTHLSLVRHRGDYDALAKRLEARAASKMSDEEQRGDPRLAAQIVREHDLLLGKFAEIEQQADALKDVAAQAVATIRAKAAEGVSRR